MIGQGAEAKVFRTVYMERDAILKIRPVKRYRHPDLDRRLRVSRTKNEAKLMREARSAGVRTPVIYDIDLKECGITMEYIRGRRVKEILDENPERSAEICTMIGEALAKLHRAGICHGDPTTSNMILTPGGELCLIDLSLGGSAVGIEEMGVDIHLMKRAFDSAHSSVSGGFGLLSDSYVMNAADGRSVMRRVDDIEGRGRYT